MIRIANIIDRGHEGDRAVGRACGAIDLHSGMVCSQTTMNRSARDTDEDPEVDRSPSRSG